MKYIYLGVIMALLISCGDKEKVQATYNHQGRIEIVDSIKINYNGNFLLVDKGANNLLGIDFFTKKLIVHDLLSDSTTVIAEQGVGDENYRELWGASFMNDSTIILASKEGLVFYSTGGEFKKKTPYEYNELRDFYNLQWKVYIDNNNRDTIVYASIINNFHGKAGRLEYYEDVTNIMKVNVRKSEYKSIVPFQENSRYREDGNFYSRNRPMLGFGKNSYFTAFPSDDKIYEYDIKTDSLIRYISMDHDYWVEGRNLTFSENEDLMSTETGGAEEENECRKTNSSNNSFHVKGDTLITTYCNPFPKEQRKDDMYAQNMVLETERQKYIQVFVDGKKLVKDFELPSQIYAIEVFESTDRVYMRRSNRLDMVGAEDNVVYIGKIIIE